MNQQEVYYKFILTNYHSLTYRPGNPNFVPTNDGIDQLGEVRALCNQCPERVITYDQLASANPIPMYANGTNGWTSAKKNTIKSYIDAWLREPKYFNLRNYWDAKPCQEGGMSLMVSHTPEVGGDYGDWTKLHVNGKTVYFSLIVSSGDFFYSFTLPDKVIKKSGLRDKIVNDRFHANWFFTATEKTEWKNIFNVDVGQEKRVFVQSYFNENFPYGNQAAPKFYVYYYNGDSKYLRESVSCLGKDGNTYTGTSRNFPPHAEVSRYYLTDDPSVTLTRSQRYTSYDVTKNESHYYLNSNPSVEVSPIRTVELYSDFSEDLKRDFIDLEATRRILYYDDTYNSSTQLKYTENGTTRYVIIQPTNDIPKIVSGVYHDTEISYDPPAIYDNAKPLQIPYDLLRYTLNDRPPFTDCETVLVMWVADSGTDPDDVADNNVKALHDLNWQQYAIPMSIRCCYKQPISGKKFCRDRFLVSYPSRWNINRTPIESTYRYHIRCNETYNKNEFREALYMRDLVEYSKDYVITYQYTGYHGTKRYDLDGDGVKETSINYNDVFNVQRYILQRRIVNGIDAFKKLYVKKCYKNTSMNQQQQAYYLAVPDDAYRIVTNKAALAACFCKSSTDTDTLFAPSEVLTREDHENWDFDDVTYQDKYGLNDWRVEDSRFIALFDASSSIFSTVTGILELVDADNLRSFLTSKVPNYSWDDIYFSSIGFSNADQMAGESFMTSSSGCTHFSIGFLDNHIKIGNTTYGSSIDAANKKVVVGFKYLLDSKYEGLYHFHYYAASHSYKSVVATYNSSTGEYDLTEKPVTCTAYVMNYSV